jgi:hypothetical protein
MSHLRVIICRVDDESDKQMTELASFDLDEPKVSEMEADRALDEMEATTVKVGHQVLRELFKVQWEEVDQVLVEQYRQDFSP